MKGQITLDEQQDSTTPMMRQYLATKQQYQDSLLFYRMGDFYELFFEDAIIASKVLDITLTKRGKYKDADIPMCGVPWHSYEQYLHKIIKSGYKVAICEQMESPEEAKKRGHKAVVKREVVRIVTSGTLVEDNLLEAKQANYLASIGKTGDKIALAWVDVSTGEFATNLTSANILSSDLARINPMELLVSDKLINDEIISHQLREYKQKITIQVDSLFDENKTATKFKNFFAIKFIDGLGDFEICQIIACGALIEYIDITQKGQLPRLCYPKLIKNDQFMAIDPATYKNLEIYTTLSGHKNGSFLNNIDYTMTSSGARLLNKFLATPLASKDGINARLDAVDFFSSNISIREGVRNLLKETPDLERSLSRVCIKKSGPLDIQAIAIALNNANKIYEIFSSHNVQIPRAIYDNLQFLTNMQELVVELFSALQSQLPRFVRDGNFIASGYNKKLDDLRLLNSNAKQAINNLRDKYRQLTNINTLKISDNNVLGYFVEVTPSNSNKITQDIFIHRQTLGSSLRYTTVELKDLERNILNASHEALNLEIELFAYLENLVIANAEEIYLIAQSLAYLDVFSSFSYLSQTNGYVKPVIDDSTNFVIKDGRHLVVEENLNNKSEFITNDCNLSPKQRLWLLTGPNMAGKSTYLRQNALIVLLAQIGCYVPASYAYIGVVDRLFSRVGASDDLASGRSTFMMEMVETAIILNQATSKSFVILDEIGRGTSTYDGLAIAWAVAEHLHNHNKSRTLFATHYHELTLLAARLSNLALYTMQVKEWQNDIIFLHKIIEGAAKSSYGVHVAKLAGLPKLVVKRATQILLELEKNKQNYPESLLVGDLPLFSSSHKNNDEQEKSFQDNNYSIDLANKIRSINIDDLSPKEALNILYELHNIVSR